MTYTALIFAFIAGMEAVLAGLSWTFGLGWRKEAAAAVAAAVAAVLMVALL